MIQSSLKILEDTGVRLYSEEALELLRSVGVDIHEGNLARIPSGLVEQAISSTPKSLTIYDRNGVSAMGIGIGKSFYGPGSDCLNIVDHHSGKRRNPLLSDVIEGIQLCDSLENIDFAMSMFLPVDVDKEIADRYQMEVMLQNTTKPIIFVTYDKTGCEDVVKMAEAVAGSPILLKEKPFVACYINVTAGLRHNEDALEKLLFLAEKGIPAFYIPGAMVGTAGPVTVAGSNALRMAGTLAGVVISQLKNEGAPIFIPGWGAFALDMRTTVQSYTGPDHQGVAQSIAYYLGLPMFSLGGATDSTMVDQQSGIEAALTLFINALSGSHIIHDLGYLESGLSGSLSQLVICNEILAWIKRCLSPVEISEETLGLEIINEVGPDGHFIDTEHTLKHFREQWHPRLFNRLNYETWTEKGSKTLCQRASETVDEILAKYIEKPLSENILDEIKSIINNAAGEKV